MIAAGVVTFVVCLLAARGFDGYIQLPPVLFELIKISFIFIVCMAVYIPLNLMMKMDYASELAGRIKSRLGR